MVPCLLRNDVRRTLIPRCARDRGASTQNPHNLITYLSHAGSFDYAQGQAPVSTPGFLYAFYFVTLSREAAKSLTQRREMLRFAQSL